MKAIDFEERTHLIAEHQEQYQTLPAFVGTGADGQMVFCWKLSWRERFKLLVTGRLWHAVLTFRNDLQPQQLLVDYPFNAIRGECHCGCVFKPRHADVFFADMEGEEGVGFEAAVCPRCGDNAMVLAAKKRGKKACASKE